MLFRFLYSYKISTLDIPSLITELSHAYSNPQQRTELLTEKPEHFVSYCASKSSHDMHLSTSLSVYTLLTVQLLSLTLLRNFSSFMKKTGISQLFNLQMIYLVGLLLTGPNLWLGLTKYMRLI